ncbi:hypothetical protein RFI_26183 [Reticulomyxa filosa]|uniref:Uncharacterized protein n=1 Tax=Reticulomyxa filosa TaxID=46433 RepID=X6MCL7_RETFI|nr:hypothetical protein RFI_26183 [Reticulomyxa filosa]|eukprot:ETO11197.1 hypothetical protein RFI_26183 [Reticulomyxa filosa]
MSRSSHKLQKTPLSANNFGSSAELVSKPYKIREVYTLHKFGTVEAGIYRASSNQITPDHHKFIDSLNLKSILFLSQEVPNVSLRQYLQKRNYSLYKDKGDNQQEENEPLAKLYFAPGYMYWQDSHTWNVNTDKLIIEKCLLFILNKLHLPVLILNNHGKFEISTLIGCLRRLQNWNLTSIFKEYHIFVGGHRRVNLQLIETFDHDKRFYGQIGLLPSWFKDQIEMNQEDVLEIKKQIWKKFQSKLQAQNKTQETDQEKTALPKKDSSDYKEFMLDISKAPLVCSEDQFTKPTIVIFTFCLISPIFKGQRKALKCKKEIYVNLRFFHDSVPEKRRTITVF